MKKYRFFYHYYKQKHKMSVHFKGQCHVVDDVECDVPCKTKWCKTQPRLKMAGSCFNVTIVQNGLGNNTKITALIS